MVTYAFTRIYKDLACRAGHTRHRDIWGKIQLKMSWFGRGKLLANYARPQCGGGLREIWGGMVNLGIYYSWLRTFCVHAPVRWTMSGVGVRREAQELTVERGPDWGLNICRLRAVKEVEVVCAERLEGWEVSVLVRGEC